MKATIDMSRLIDLMMEADDASYDYSKSSRNFFRQHGYGVNLGHVKSDEERHIVYAYHSDSAHRDAVWSILEVLGLDTEQKKRLFSAKQAMKRWYEKETKWQRLPSDELLGRLACFVMG